MANYRIIMHREDDSIEAEHIIEMGSALDLASQEFGRLCGGMSWARLVLVDQLDEKHSPVIHGLYVRSGLTSTPMPGSTALN